MTAMIFAFVAMPAGAQSRKEKKAMKKQQWEMRQQFIQDSIKMAHQYKLDSMRNAHPVYIGQKANVPCVEYSYDKHGVYMAGLGIAQNQPDLGTGTAEANRQAISDIMTRFIGVIKNGVSNYAKEVNGRSGQKIKESELEGEATAIGQKTIEKLGEPVCRNHEIDTHGNYTVYVALHVPIKEMLDEILSELDILRTDSDREKFRQFMQTELEKQPTSIDTYK